MPRHKDHQHRSAWSGLVSAVTILLVLGCATPDHHPQQVSAGDVAAEAGFGNKPPTAAREDRTARSPAEQMTGPVFLPPVVGPVPTGQPSAADTTDRAAACPVATPAATGNARTGTNVAAAGRVGSAPAVHNPAGVVAPPAPAVPVGPFARRSSTAVVAQRANEHISYAQNLGLRGAVYSARAEFIMALELVAGALDADTGTRVHTSAVEAGLTALKEADDFAPSQPRHETHLNLAHLAAVHRTVVLRQNDTREWTPAEALQRYYTYATGQLARAGGNNPIAAKALYGLGRTESVVMAGSGNRTPLAGPKAIAFYQAALLVDPRHHLAANELGVLLARYGHMQQAEEALLHSVSVAPEPETWHNLATVRRRLGRHEQARQAQEQHESLVAARRASGTASVSAADGQSLLRWVDVETFARTVTPYGLEGPATGAVPPVRPQAASAPRLSWRQPFSGLAGWLRPNKAENADASTQTSRPDDSRRGNRFAL